MIDALAARAGLALMLLALVAAVGVARAHAKPFVPREAQLPRALLPTGAAPVVAFYFTSRLCGDCMETPTLLADAAPQVPRVALPVERHAKLARDFGVTQTPTILLADTQGRVLGAFAGNPSPDALRAAVDAAARR